MTCEHFAEGDSLLHRTDPRIKILCAMAFSVCVACLSTFQAETMALCTGTTLLLTARLEKGLLFKRLILVNAFILFLWGTIPWSTPGKTMFALGPLTLTREGIYAASAITLKANAIILGNIALLSTSTVISLSHALAHLKVPSKLVQLFFFSWRYLHVVEEEFNRMKEAMRARGFIPGTNLATYRTYGYLMGTLFLRSQERGEQVYNAMLCRGFNGTFWLLSHFSMGGRDVAFAGVLIFVTGAIILADLRFKGVV